MAALVFPQCRQPYRHYITWLECCSLGGSDSLYSTWSHNNGRFMTFAEKKSHPYPEPAGALGGTVGWGTALQAGRSRVRFIWIFLWHNPGVDSASERNAYQEYFMGGKGGGCVGLTTLPSSCPDFLEIWEPEPAGTLRACPGLSWDCFILSQLNLFNIE